MTRLPYSTIIMQRKLIEHVILPQLTTPTYDGLLVAENGMVSLIHVMPYDEILKMKLHGVGAGDPAHINDHACVIINFYCGNVSQEPYSFITMPSNSDWFDYDRLIPNSVKRRAGDSVISLMRYIVDMMQRNTITTVINDTLKFDEEEILTLYSPLGQIYE